MLIATYAIGLVALLVSAAAIFRTYCEGFGCIGIGILWMAWAGAYVAWLLLGVVAQARARQKARGTALAGRLFGGQVVVGAALLAYWALQRFG